MKRTLLPLLFLVFALHGSVASQHATTGRVVDVSRQRLPGTNADSQIKKPYVVLVALDGFRADYLDLFPTPALQRIAREGVRAEGMTPVFPSKTLPNLYTIVTGMYADHHQMVSNEFYDPRTRELFSMFRGNGIREGSYFFGEPLWVTAERQGMVSASFFWPGSEAAIKGIRPTFWKAYDSKVTIDERIDGALGWLRMPPATRPHLINVYLSDVDSAGHDAGPATPEVKAAIERVDAGLTRLLDGIDQLDFRDQITVIVVSDHGMTETSPDRFVALNGLIDLTQLKTGDSGPVYNLHVSGGPREARALKAEINAKVKHGRAYLRAELPSSFHYRNSNRVGDVVIVMEEHYMTGREQHRPRRAGGNHGWDPALPSMRGIFLARGSGLRQGAKLPLVRNIDIYPFVTELLSLRPAQGIDGKHGALRSLCTRPSGEGKSWSAGEGANR